MKYVLIESHDRIYPIIFADGICHDSVIPAISKMGGERKVVSAGFCGIQPPNYEWVCYGNSETLHLISNPIKDSKFLTDFFDFGESALYLISQEYKS